MWSQAAVQIMDTLCGSWGEECHVHFSVSQGWVAGKLLRGCCHGEDDVLLYLSITSISNDVYKLFEHLSLPGVCTGIQICKQMHLIRLFCRNHLHLPQSFIL